MPLSQKFPLANRNFQFFQTWVVTHPGILHYTWWNNHFIPNVCLCTCSIWHSPGGITRNLHICNFKSRCLLRAWELWYLCTASQSHAKKSLQKSNTDQVPSPWDGPAASHPPREIPFSSSSHTERMWITHNSAQTSPSSKKRGFLPTPYPGGSQPRCTWQCVQLAFTHHNARKKHQSTVKNTI